MSVASNRDDMISMPQVNSPINGESEARACRICLDDDETLDNPIVNCCECKGAAGDIHINCLREWLNQKRKVNNLSEFQTNYIYKKCVCEICGFLYPDMVGARGQTFSVFDFKKPTGCNYMVIEVLGMPMGKNFSVIEVPEDYKLEIGRNEAEICIPDVSVSKKHGYLRFDPSIRELILIE